MSEYPSCGTTVSKITNLLKSLGRVLLWTCVLGFILLAATTSFDPFQSVHIQRANMVAVAARGKDIFSAITNANTERKPLGLPPIWPKTYLSSTNYLTDISGKVFKTSTEYFVALYDEEHIGTDACKPYVRGFDYSKLAGAGVPCCPPGQRLTSANNMWAIAANITEDDADIIPVLISRNADVKAIEQAVNGDFANNSPDVKIALGMGDYTTPFGNKGFVCIRKGGGTFYNTAKYATTRVLFNSSKTYRKRDPSKPPIVYLMP